MPSRAGALRTEVEDHAQAMLFPASDATSYLNASRSMSTADGS
jgi:hypothetical protein